MLVNVRSHMMFRPEIIYIFLVNCQPNYEILKNRCLSFKNRYKTERLIELQKPFLIKELTRSANKKTTRKKAPK